jgi:uncharacterized protein (DUF1330 family)
MYQLRIGTKTAVDTLINFEKKKNVINFFSDRDYQDFLDH